MMSIVQRDLNRCYLCGRRDQPLDIHHIFGGALRRKSEHYGLKVRLCHDSCHIFGQNAVHVDRRTDLMLKRRAQKIAMLKYDWTEEEWRQEFYKSYLTLEDLKEISQ